MKIQYLSDARALDKLLQEFDLASDGNSAQPGSRLEFFLDRALFCRPLHFYLTFYKNESSDLLLYTIPQV